MQVSQAWAVLIRLSAGTFGRVMMAATHHPTVVRGVSAVIRRRERWSAFKTGVLARIKPRHSVPIDVRMSLLWVRPRAPQTEIEVTGISVDRFDTAAMASGEDGERDWLSVATRNPREVWYYRKDARRGRGTRKDEEIGGHAHRMGEQGGQVSKRKAGVPGTS